MPIQDPSSAQMIAVGPQVALNIDASIPPAFRATVGSPADQKRALVTVLNIGNPNQVPQAMLHTVTGPNGQQKQVGDLKIPMPSTMAGFVQSEFDGHARSVLHTYKGIPFKSWEFEYPQLQPDGTWTCENVTEHDLNDDYSHTFLTSSGSGSGMSFEKYLLTGNDLSGEITHPLLFTLPPRFFGLHDPVNYSYCTGLATMPLFATAAEGGQPPASAWGTGVTIYLKTIPLPPLSPQAQRVIRCLQTYGAMLNDRDSAARKPEAVAITGETTVPTAVALELSHAGLNLGHFYVGKIPARYNWRTKQYPVNS